MLITLKKKENHLQLYKEQNSLIFYDCSAVMDNEKFFTFDRSFMPGNDHFYNDYAECPDDARYVGLKMLPLNLMEFQSHFSVQQRLKPSIR